MNSLDLKTKEIINCYMEYSNRLSVDDFIKLRKQALSEDNTEVPPLEKKMVFTPKDKEETIIKNKEITNKETINKEITNKVISSEDMFLSMIKDIQD